MQFNFGPGSSHVSSASKLKPWLQNSIYVAFGYHWVISDKVPGTLPRHPGSNHSAKIAFMLHPDTTGSQLGTTGASLTSRALLLRYYYYGIAITGQ